MRWGGTLIVLGLLAAPAMALADGWAAASATASVGGTVTISATGVDPGGYVLLLADAEQPACAARLSGPTKASKGRVKLTGRVPRTLSCRVAGSTSSEPVLSGSYTATLCQAASQTTCDASHTVITHTITVRGKSAGRH